MNLDAYNNREVQNIISMLVQCEVEGVTDVRYVRVRFQTHINKQFAEARKIRTRTTLKKNRCPDCDYPLTEAKTDGESFKVMECPACRYSEVR